jgi:hypothetical protein
VRRLEAQKPACTGFCALTEHRCAQKPPEGTPCRASTDCASDQTCANAHCVARAAETPAPVAGAATCTTDLDCSAGGCVATADGTRACGKKCSRELSALAGTFPVDAPRALALPTKSQRPAP